MGIAEISSQIEAVLLLTRDYGRCVMKECEVCKFTKTTNGTGWPQVVHRLYGIRYDFYQILE